MCTAALVSKLVGGEFVVCEILSQLKLVDFACSCVWNLLHKYHVFRYPPFGNLALQPAHNISLASPLVATKTGNKQWYFHTAEFAQLSQVYSLESATGFTSRSSIVCLGSVCQASSAWAVCVRHCQTQTCISGCTLDSECLKTSAAQADA